MEQKTEKKVAQEILQQPQTVVAGAYTYKVYPPSCATLILASAAIADLPQVKLDEKHIAEETLYIAKDCRPIGEIVAILLLGAKRIEADREAGNRITRAFRRLFGMRRKSEKDELADKLLRELTPRQLYTLMTQLLQRMQLGDFFALTTFLQGLSLTRTTKVESETTASGQ